MDKFPFITTPSIWQHEMGTYSAHLKGLVNHHSRLQYKRKKEEIERKAEYASLIPPKPTIYWSFRLNAKGTPILTIRKRKPAYLLLSEAKELFKTHKVYIREIKRMIKKRKVKILFTSPGSAE